MEKLWSLVRIIRVGIDNLRVSTMAFPVAILAQSSQTPLPRCHQQSPSDPCGAISLKKVQLALSCMSICPATLRHTITGHTRTFLSMMSYMFGTHH